MTIVDSGYENEENYRYADESEKLSLFVKPSNHEQKKKRKYQNDIGRRENMTDNAEKDEYICANGKQWKTVSVKKRKSDTGYTQEVTVYECADCKGYPLENIHIKPVRPAAGEIPAVGHGTAAGHCGIALSVLQRERGLPSDRRTASDSRGKRKRIRKKRVNFPKSILYAKEK